MLEQTALEEELLVWNSRTRTQSIGVALIVLLGGGILLYRNLSSTPTPVAASSVRPVFQWSDFLGPPEPAKGRNDWQPTIRKGTYETFEALRDELINNRLTPASIDGFETIVVDPDRFQRVSVLLGEIDGEKRNRAIAQLYAELMRSESNPDVLFGHLMKEIAKAFDNVSAHPDDNGRYSGWALSFTNQSCLVAYQATGEERFLDLLADVIERSLSYRDDRLGRLDEARGRIMHSWGGTRYTKDGRHTTNITLAGRVCFPMLRFCRIVRMTPQLQDKFGEQTERFLTEARVCMDEYESEFRAGTLPGEGFYYRITHDAVEALNHQASAGNALILLYELTGDEKYGRMAKQLATFFRNCMWTDANDRLVWTYMPSPSNRRGPPRERVWKARVTSRFPLFAYQHGVVFTRQDMNDIARMFLQNVYRGDGRFSSYIDDNFEDMELRKDFRGGYLSLTPFIIFDEFQPEVREVLEDLVATRPDIGGWFKAGHGIEAYAYRLKPRALVAAESRD